jgi:2-polyprenyl-3-methyl-5-hydroxy-6-metoxy-1,4-benzoquinol methylase
MGFPTASPTESQAEFVNRRGCVTCSGGAFTPLWQARFADEPVRSYLKECAYATDVVTHLREQTFALVRCDDCGTQFHRAVLTQDWLARLYDAWIDRRQIEIAERRRNQFEHARQLMKHVLRLESLTRRSCAGRTPRLLDYGCGAGNFVALARLFGWDTVGVDVSAVRGDQATVWGVDIVERLDDDRVRPPYDVITLFQVLEHVIEPLPLVRELTERLAPSGILVVEVPDCSGITKPLNYEEFALVHPLEHVNAFTRSTLVALCKRAGLVPVRRPPAHVTTALLDVAKSEVSRFVSRRTTNQYFTRPAPRK